MKYFHPRIVFRKTKAIYQTSKFFFKKAVYGPDIANDYLKLCNKEAVLSILLKHGAKIGDNCDIESGLTFHNCTNFLNLTMGNNCHIGKNCFLDLRDKIVIGNNVTISMNCSLITHQDMGKSSLDKVYGKSQNPIIINNDVFIGVNSTILQGVSIGKESIVAAGSLVKNNIENGGIVGGVPAKQIQK